jgi:ubiquinone/menaquinone biosynthesis C-methylase UbiE
VAGALHSETCRMTTTTDVTPLKEIQKFIWSQGDYAALAREGMHSAGELVDAVGVGARQDVLDVAAGDGNVAIAAARRGARVVASDLTPRMLELGRARSDAERLSIDWVEADAEALPFADASFDRVLSSFGAMFAPRPEVATAELFRVLRPGGVVGLANWTPESFIGRAVATVSSFMPPPPDGVPAATQWGVEEVVRERLADYADDVGIERRTVAMVHPSVDAMLEFQRRNNGPCIAASMVLGDRAPELAAALRDVIAELNQATDGTAHVEAEYLLVTAR